MYPCVQHRFAMVGILLCRIKKDFVWGYFFCLLKTTWWLPDAFFSNLDLRSG
jgi:hypothetical protein